MPAFVVELAEIRVPRRAGKVDHRVVWRRLDAPGFEAFRLRRATRGWVLEGVAVFVHEHEPCRLDYRVRTDEQWRTRDASLSGWIASRSLEIDVELDADGRWTQNDVDCPAVVGCVDVDLGFSPATNTLPIRRLDLAVGQSAVVHGAWLPFPLLELCVREQPYTPTSAHAYMYEAGTFRAEIEVDELGVVRGYSGLWQRAT
jgi:hypothetical protein